MQQCFENVSILKWFVACLVSVVVAKYNKFLFNTFKFKVIHPQMSREVTKIIILFFWGDSETK